MSIYHYIPHLAVLVKRKTGKLPKGIEPINLTDIPPDLKRDVANHIRDEIMRAVNPQPVEPTLYLLEVLVIAMSDSRNLKERFLSYYSRLALKNKKALSYLQKYIECTDELSMKEYLQRASRLQANPLKLYWLEIEKGKVKLGSYSCILSLLEDISRLLEETRKKIGNDVVADELRDILSMSQRKPSGRTPRFYKRLLDATGIEDGKKRIIMYWIAPYLISIANMPKEEAINTILEWLSRQEGQRVPNYWVRAEVEAVARKKLMPWKKDKVLEKDPQLKEILQKHGII